MGKWVDLNGQVVTNSYKHSVLKKVIGDFSDLKDTLTSQGCKCDFRVRIDL